MTQSTTGTTVLAAARRVFEQYGVRRANVDDVARAAGVSRSTLYRRYPSKDALLEAVLLLQYDEFLTELDRVAADLPPRQAVVECFVRGLALTREIPLLARLSESEPEVITGMGSGSHAALILVATERVAGTLRRSGATMPDEDLHEVAELLLRVAYSYLLNTSGTLDVTDPDAVRRWAERRLAPLVH
jgi:TetR/AcrR family transcriptional regulator